MHFFSFSRKMTLKPKFKNSMICGNKTPSRMTSTMPNSRSYSRTTDYLNRLVFSFNTRSYFISYKFVFLVVQIYSCLVVQIHRVLFIQLFRDTNVLSYKFISRTDLFLVVQIYSFFVMETCHTISFSQRTNFFSSNKILVIQIFFCHKLEHYLNSKHFS